MRPEDQRELLPAIVALARHAGAAILDVKRKAVADVETKADGSPVTLADRAAHDLIVAGLRALEPRFEVLSEEGDLQATAERIRAAPDTPFWLVDPLDGTKEFVRELGEYTVNIALVENGTPVLGVVHPPEQDRVYYAARGFGAHRQDGRAAPLTLAANARQREARVVASRSHLNDATRALIDRLSTSTGGVELVQRGSSVKLCAVAEGSADVYPRLAPTFIWDTAAGCIVAREAGCAVVDPSGTPLDYTPAGDLRQSHFMVYTQRRADIAAAMQAEIERGRG
jgi:3'(2'), 5'-bisphosphate nucleotidase